MHTFFGGVGNVIKYANKVNYKVRKLEDLCNVILPHFTKFPQRADFELFKQGVLYIKDKK